MFKSIFSITGASDIKVVDAPVSIEFLVPWHPTKAQQTSIKKNLLMLTS
jgi:hypothetical protein